MNPRWSISRPHCACLCPDADSIRVDDGDYCRRRGVQRGRGKAILLIGGGPEVLASAILVVGGLGLYFLPVYLAKLWIKKYDPTLPLLRPTKEEVTQSLAARESKTVGSWRY